jgi:hypothetical protein
MRNTWNCNLIAYWLKWFVFCFADGGHEWSKYGIQFPPDETTYRECVYCGAMRKVKPSKRVRLVEEPSDD